MRAEDRLQNTVDSLKIISDLASELRLADVSCCVWKGTANLEQALQGAKDIDLLIDRAHLAQFRSIADKLGFRDCAAKYPIPGVFDFLALDEATGKLVHLHLHLRIIAGHPLTYNYHLPVERLVLETRVRGNLFDQISGDLEFILFVSRMTLYRSRLNSQRREEYQFLYERLGGNLPEQTRSDVLPMIPRSLWDDTCRALREGKIGSYSYVWHWIRHQWHTRLNCETVDSKTHELGLRIWRRTERFLQRRLGGSLTNKLQIPEVAKLHLVRSSCLESARLAASMLGDWLSEYLEVRIHPRQTKPGILRNSRPYVGLIPSASNANSCGLISSRSIPSISAPESVDDLRDATVVKQLKRQLWRNL